MKKLAAAALAFALAACATPYGEANVFGGVSAAPMGGDVYRIQAQLNAFSSPEMVQDYLLLRAAETAQANGAEGFVIVDSRDATRTSTIVTPGQSYTTANAYGYGNSAFGSATTTYQPPIANTVVAPGGILMIRLVRQPGEGDNAFLRASDIIAAIGPRVRR